MSSPIDSSQLMYNAGGSFYDYEITNSLRLNSGDASSLIFTPSVTGSSNKIFTVAFWFKRTFFGDQQHIFSSKNTGTSAGQGYTGIGFNAENQLYYFTENGGQNGKTKQFIRDPSAWFHVCWQYDTNQATAANRIKFFVNGVQIVTTTDFWINAGHGLYPAEDSVMTSANASGQAQQWALDAAGNSEEPGGYLAEVHMLDGVSTDCTSFGEFKNGIWIPKDYSGSYGTNGYRFEFKQVGTSQNASGIGADTSGNDNHFAVANIVAGDVVPDSPTNNWCTLNPISDDDQNPNVYAQGALSITHPSGGFESTIATFPLPRTGKWYWEYRTGAGGSSIYGRPSIITVDEFYTQAGGDDRDNISGGSDTTSPNGVLFTANDGGKRTNNNDASFGAAVSAGDKIGLAYDADTGQLFIYKNNSIQASGVAINESIKGNFAGKDVFIMHERYNGGGADIYNFGQDSSFAAAETAQSNADGNGLGDFYYSPPSGYLALCSSNLTEPEIIDGTEHFNTVIYSGNGDNNRSISVGHASDFVWLKTRNEANFHQLFDSVRGAGKHLVSSATTAEVNQDANGYISFNSDGFVTVDGSNSNSRVNYDDDSTNTYVAWSWVAGTAASGSESGNNPAFSSSSSSKAGFSIVSYTGTGSAGTVGHGCGAVPSFIFIKNRDVTDNWAVYYGDNTDYLILNTNAATADAAAWWNDTTPTDSVFTVGTDHAVNADGEKYIAYCFTDIEGYCKAGGLYSGNANADGTFVFTGFRPAWLMVKAYNNARNFTIYDNKRAPFNLIDAHLHANADVAEQTGEDEIDFLSNGFKFRTNEADSNYSGFLYTYLAFAEQPFKFSNAR